MKYPRPIRLAPFLVTDLRHHRTQPSDHFLGNLLLHWFQPSQSRCPTTPALALLWVPPLEYGVFPQCAVFVALPNQPQFCCSVHLRPTDHSCDHQAPRFDTAADLHFQLIDSQEQRHHLSLLSRHLCPTVDQEVVFSPRSKAYGA